MNETKFSKWVLWNKRIEFGEQLKYPGGYIIAYFHKDISSTTFLWCREIVYK